MISAESLRASILEVGVGARPGSRRGDQLVSYLLADSGRVPVCGKPLAGMLECCRHVRQRVLIEVDQQWMPIRRVQE